MAFLAMFYLDADYFRRPVRRALRQLQPVPIFRRVPLGFCLALGMGCFCPAPAQQASRPCTFPFLLTVDASFFQAGQAQQAPSIPPELQDRQTTVSISTSPTGSQKKVKDTYWAQGNVVLTFREFRLAADEATFNETSGEITARGHVVFIDPRARLEADEAHYNVQTDKGWFSNGRGYFHTAARPRPRVVVTANPFYVQARRVNRLDEDSYMIERGQVSSCDNEAKGWALSVRNARLEVGDKIVAHGAFFRLVQVPLFYMPVMAGPVAPRERQTGFLLPNIGTSTQKGYILGDGFFWAINPSVDLEVGLEDYSKRGLWRQAQFRAKPSDTSDLTVEYSGINDKASGRLGQQRAPGDSVRAIGQAEDLAYGFRGVLDFDYVSSLAFREVWSETFAQAVSSEVHETAFLTKDFGANSLSLYASRYQNFLCATGGAQALGISTSLTCPPATGSGGAAGNSVTIRQLPGVSLSRLDTQLGDSPFYFAADASVSAVGRTQPGFATPELSERFDVHPEVTLRTEQFLDFYLTPTLGLDVVHYGTSLRPDHSPINRILGDFSADLRPPSFEKVFQRSLWGHRIKHVIEPDIRYHLVRAGDKEDINDVIRFDQIDILSETNEIEYSLTNTLLARKDAPDDSGETPQAREVLSLQLSQKYYFDPTFGGALQPGQKIVWDPAISLTGFAFAQGRRLSPIVSVLKVAPFSNYDTELRADIDPSGGGVLNAGITSHVHRGLLGLALTDFFINRTATLFTLPPPGTPLSQLPSFNLLRTVATYGDVNRKGFSGALGLDYNFAQGIAQQMVSQASYNFGCFGLNIEYRRFALGTLRQENSYRVALSLSNVGTFGNLKPRERLY